MPVPSGETAACFSFFPVDVRAGLLLLALPSHGCIFLGLRDSEFFKGKHETFLLKPSVFYVSRGVFCIHFMSSGS